YTGIGAGVAAAIRGVPVKVVACYVPGPTAVLIARPEFKSVQDLRGKTIGINSFGSNLEIIGRNIFNHFGLDPDKEIKFLAAGPLEARFSSMKQRVVCCHFECSTRGFSWQEDGLCCAGEGPRTI